MTAQPKHRRHRRTRGFWERHSLTVVAGSILALWLVLYSFGNPDTHLGNFFGNAIADWSGVVVMVLASKFLYERGSQESNSPPPDLPGGKAFDLVRDFVRDHSLTIFLAVTLLAWIALYLHSSVNSKWGQVVGNIVSEWVQAMGTVLLTKRFIEQHAKM